MIDHTALKAKRTSGGIAGNVLCKKVGIARSRLSNIERGFITASPEELTRLDAVLDELIRAKAVIEKTAAALGWPVAEVR